MATKREPRTQQQRKDETVGRLIQATIDAIAEVGYHRCSLGEICTRAGVSRGGLFRHFESRLELVVAAAEEVGRRQLVEAIDRYAGVGKDLGEVLAYAREHVRQPMNAVWFELLVAARTDDELRRRLQPVAENLLDSIETAVLPLAAEFGVAPARMRLLITSVLHLFDGEAIFRVTYPRPELEDERLAALAAALLQVGA